MDIQSPPETKKRVRPHAERYAMLYIDMNEGREDVKAEES